MTERSSELRGRSAGYASNIGRERLTFDGWIAAVGTGSGTRVVVGHWPRSPFGPFSWTSSKISRRPEWFEAGCMDMPLSRNEEADLLRWRRSC